MKKNFLFFYIPVLLAFPFIPVEAATSTGEIKEAVVAVSPEPVLGSIQSAMKEFKELSGKEKRTRFKEMKKALKQFKADKKAGDDISTQTLLQVVLSIFIPPLAVYLHEGETNNRFWISVLLTILGYLLFGFAGVLFLGSLPGIIYALIVVLGS